MTSESYFMFDKNLDLNNVSIPNFVSVNNVLSYEGDYFIIIDNEQITFEDKFNETVFVKVIELLKYLAVHYDVSGYGYHERGIEPELETGKTLLEISKFWPCMIINKQNMEKIDEQLFQSAPCKIIETLDNGFGLLSIHNNTFSSFFEERQKLREHFNE